MRLTDFGACVSGIKWWALRVAGHASRECARVCERGRVASRRPRIARDGGASSACSVRTACSGCALVWVRSSSAADHECTRCTKDHERTDQNAHRATSATGPRVSHPCALVVPHTPVACALVVRVRSERTPCSVSYRPQARTRLSDAEYTSRLLPTESARLPASKGRACAEPRAAAPPPCRRTAWPSA